MVVLVIEIFNLRMVVKAKDARRHLAVQLFAKSPKIQNFRQKHIWRRQL